MGTIGLATATSFFPSKPLGAYGDAGAVFTQDEALAQTMLSMRMHGMGKVAYDHVEIGMNGRLDALQAAILLEKLKIFPRGDRGPAAASRPATTRCSPASRARLRFDDETPSVWAQYTLRLDPEPPRGLSAPRCRRRACRPRCITPSL